MPKSARAVVLVSCGLLGNLDSASENTFSSAEFITPAFWYSPSRMSELAELKEDPEGLKLKKARELFDKYDADGNGKIE